MAANGQVRAGSVEEGQRRLAVLIDADNAQASVIEGLLAEIAKFGVASVKRIYGDWTEDRLKKWKAVLLRHSIQPMQQFAYSSGKNSTDSSMIIDAMDLMYTGRFDGFCLVTSDSDFTRLAQRLRQETLTVYGFGEKKTPDAFRQACDKFVFTEVLRAVEPVTPTAAPVAKNAAPRPKVAKETPVAEPIPPIAAAEEVEPLPFAVLRQAIDQASDDAGWANLAPVGAYINKVLSDFDSRLYGFRKLSELFRKNPQHFQVEERSVGSSRALFVKSIE